jgi:hypothetical protein
MDGTSAFGFGTQCFLTLLYGPSLRSPSVIILHRYLFVVVSL